MKKLIPTALSIPSLVIALCAVFVEIECYLEQTAELQISGLIARALIVVSFAVFLYHARRYEIFSVLKTIRRDASENATASATVA